MIYDFFGYMAEELELALKKDDADKLGERFKHYELNRELSNIIGKILGVTISPGMAWQVAELIYGGASMLVTPEIEAMKQEIGQLLGEIRRLPKGNTERRQKEEQKNKLNKQRSLLDSLVSTKPIWGIPTSDNFHTISFYAKDEDTTRVDEAASLPTLCFRMKIQVPMKTPIVIEGDRPFVANENPFCIDKITGWPLLRPSSLKGQARHASLACLSEEITHEDELKKRLDSIFGLGSEEKEEGHRGRVEFLPCHIKKDVDFDIIAPHDEKTRRVDPGPVTLEVIRPETLALWLQYWPLDLMTKWITGKGEGIGEKLFDDFACILKGLSYWLESVGIGAKTSSGYGQVDYEGVKVEIFCSDDSPWKKLMEKIGIKPEKAPKLKELYEATEKESTKDSWQEIWKAFEQGLKQEGDENAG